MTIEKKLMTKIPYIILTTYKPKENKCFQIGKDLTKITKELGFIPFKNDEIKRNEKAAWFDYKLHAEVRQTAVAGSEACEFHMDGDTSTDNMNFAMIVWSNHNPTEFKVGKKIFQPAPYKLVIAKNLSCFHRRPPKVNGKRLFFRQRVEVPEHIKLP